MSTGQPPLRILIVSHGHPCLSIGGGENAAYNLFQELGNRPDCKSLFLARHFADPPHVGTHFENYSADGREILFYPGQLDHFLFSQLNSRVVLQEFRALLENFKPDIVHFHHYVHLGLEFFREIRRYSARVSIVLTLHEYLAMCHHNGQMVTTRNHSLCEDAFPARCSRCFPEISGADFKLRELFIKSFFRLVDCFVAPSHFLIERYTHWGLPKEKTTFIENGQAQTDSLPPRPLRPGEQRSRLAYFGQINPYKGITVLLKALALLPDRVRHDISLSIHGVNLESQETAFREHVAEALKRTEGAARYYGPYTQAELPRLMADTDWVVVPSTWWENSPLVIQEAFKYGRPVICSDRGGMAEKVQPYESGLHFRLGDAPDLADRLIEAITTPGLWEQLRKGIPTPPAISATCNAHLSIYRELVSRTRTLAR